MPRRPPKEWLYYVVGELEKVKGIPDPQAVAGWLWYHWMKPETKKAILKGERLDPDALKVRRGLIKKPKVLGYADFEGTDSMIRILHRVDDTYFPELALFTSKYKPKMDKQRIGEVLRDAGFSEEARGKWVLRTNKFSIFVYF